MRGRSALFAAAALAGTPAGALVAVPTPEAILPLPRALANGPCTVLASGLGAAAAIDAPVRQSFVSEMVGPDLLTNAVSLNSTIFNGARLVGPSVAGLLIGHDGSRLVSGASRLQVNAVWRLVDFLLEGLVFLLIGQQLPTVVAGLHRYPTGTIAVAAAVTVGVVLLLRPQGLLGRKERIG